MQRKIVSNFEADYYYCLHFKDQQNHQIVLELKFQIIETQDFYSKPSFQYHFIDHLHL